MHIGVGLGALHELTLSRNCLCALW